MRRTALALGTAALALAPLVPAQAGAVGPASAATSSVPQSIAVSTSTRTVTASAATREPRYVTRVHTSMRVVFITLDDGVVRDKKRLLGRAPALFRAPYGSYDDRVLRMARSCGMTTVGWAAVMPERGGLETWNGHGRLNPGDVVLLHFVPGLVGQLRRVLADAERRHLRVGQLEDDVRPPR